eukprot:TRINITY_DN25049_c0_g1_i1.p1 TRINITY_DN25049_c0_g1~~TRINITY_DN25049_c0_g1_i1.p1  ORF type:complete len:323 (-),score=64.46 TRINITY_DN25049_c0_g1_i1:86-1054(-)
MSYGGDNPFEETESNPFDEKRNSGQASATRVAPNLPAKKNDQTTLRTLSPNSVQVQLKPGFDASDDGLQRKEAELRRREEELNRREAQLNQQENALAQGGGKRVNWPFFRPMIYLNIVEEVPAEQHKLVKAAYYIWFGAIWCFFWNTATVLGALIVTGDSKHIGGLILSIIYGLFFIPLFFLTFRLLYRAARKNRSSLYLWYLINQCFELAIIAWMGVGLMGWGGGGFLLMISMFSKHNDKDDDGNKDTGALIIAIFSLVITVFWGILFILHVYLFFHARIYYSRAGGFKSAKQQGTQFAAQKAAENPDVVMKAGKVAYANA